MNYCLQKYTSHQFTYFIYYSLWSLKLATLFLRPGSNFHAIHVDYVDFVPELGWQFWSRNL